MFNSVHQPRHRKPNRRRASCPATVTPMFPGSDPMAEPDAAAFALAATSALPLMSPARVQLWSLTDPEFAPVAAAVLAMDAIWGASAP